MSAWRCTFERRDLQHTRRSAHVIMMRADAGSLLRDLDGSVLQGGYTRTAKGENETTRRMIQVARSGGPGGSGSRRSRCECVRRDGTGYSVDCASSWAVVLPTYEPSAPFTTGQEADTTGRCGSTLKSTKSTHPTHSTPRPTHLNQTGPAGDRAPRPPRHVTRARTVGTTRRHNTRKTRADSHKCTCRSLWDEV